MIDREEREDPRWRGVTTKKEFVVQDSSSTRRTPSRAQTAGNVEMLACPDAAGKEPPAGEGFLFRTNGRRLMGSNGGGIRL